MRIGRNDMCPCGSGRKYKRCCLDKQRSDQIAAAAGATQRGISLQDEIEKTRNDAILGKSRLREIGVFIFFSTSGGDSWMLEVSEMDGLLLSEGGEKKEVNLVQQPDTIEIDWTHSFSIRDKQFVAVSYKDEEEKVYHDYPCQAIHAAITRIRRRYPREVLESIHVEEGAADNAV